MNDMMKVAAIIADAGGRVVGRTRLQKIAYLLCVAGLEDGFSFSYKHYGPFSEDLAAAARIGKLFGQLRVTESPTTWGGSYSIYDVDAGPTADSPESRRLLAKVAAEADAIELELAATAVFLAKDGFSDPWGETARRKPEKVDYGRLDRAKDLLRSLSSIPTPERLPEIV